MPAARHLRGRALLGAALALLVAASARADFTESLIARWTFNQPGTKALVDDVRHLPLVLGNLGRSAGNLQANDDGTLTLGVGQYLAATGVGEEGFPEWKHDVTIWARLRLDGGDLDHTSFLLGFMKEGRPGDYADATLVLLHKPATSPDSIELSAYGHHSAGKELGMGKNLLPTVPGRFFTAAVTFDSKTSTLNITVDGATKSVKKLEATALADAGAFMLGQLKSVGAGSIVTFDEVRIYRAAVSPDWIAAITPVSDPQAPTP